MTNLSTQLLASAGLAVFFSCSAASAEHAPTPRSSKTGLIPVQIAPGHSCIPQWPMETDGVSGLRSSELLLELDKGGAITGLKKLSSSGSDSLDEAAAAAARACVFIPAQQHGARVAGSFRFVHDWRVTAATMRFSNKIPATRSIMPVTASSPLSPEQQNRLSGFDPSSCAMPVYPQSSLVNEETGIVTLGFLVGLDGVVKDKKIVKSSGFTALNNSALEALAKCKFRPLENGQPVEKWVTLQWVWALE